MGAVETIITTYVRFEEEGRPIRLDLFSTDAGLQYKKLICVDRRYDLLPNNPPLNFGDGSARKLPVNLNYLSHGDSRHPKLC